MEIGGWNSEKRFKLEAHLGVISKMLIAEISRMYALVDGKIATMKERNRGCRGRKTRNTFMPNYLWKM